ncbi:hypothetical protein VNO78_20934 [Psophocarpus tetragonolobus]|uniref:Pectate lyase n=1 Tax=Psophocarpus tetragonolobus TaxID=3891 RepID=A0AAN9SAA0_PSOTE
MLQTTCILLWSVLASFLPHGTAMHNLTLPGQHPDPEAVAREVHRKVNASMARREMLGVSEKDVVASCVTGNPIDDCWKCDPNWANNRQRLADCAIGFGQNAKGGKGGQFYIVTDSSDDDPVNPKPGTLRYAVIQNEPLWIVFPTNMMIKLSQELIFNSYKTIDGRGADVHIVGGGCITLQYISNVIIHNIHIHHCHPSGKGNVRSSPEHYGYRRESDGDGISIFGSQDIWIDHCTLSRSHAAMKAGVHPRGHEAVGRWRRGVERLELEVPRGCYVMFNGAFFVPSGSVAHPNYHNAYSFEPKNVHRISFLTMSAGVLSLARDNNLGMWTRGPNDGVYISDIGPEFTDEMSKTTMPLPPSPTLILVFGLLCLLCDSTTLTTFL